MADRGHEIVEHTADVGVRVWASDLEGVFSEAATALVGLMGTATGPEVTEHVALEAEDRAALFVDWLSEILFLFEAREIVPREVRVRITDDTKLDATVVGVRAETFEQIGPGVKAVTFHGLELTDTSAIVYLDV